MNTRSRFSSGFSVRVILWIGAVVPAAALSGSLFGARAQTARPPADHEIAADVGFVRVHSIRFATHPEHTRVVVDLDAQVRYTIGQLADPVRLYLDLLDTHISREVKNRQIPVGDAFLRQIRIGQAQMGVTRVVLDLNSGAEHSVFVLPDPPRLVVDLRRPSPTGAVGSPETKKAVAAPASPAVSGDVPPRIETAPAYRSAPLASSPELPLPVVLGMSLLVGLLPAGAQTKQQLATSLNQGDAATGPAELKGLLVHAEADSIQVTFELDAKVQYKSGWLSSGRLYFDLLNTRIGPALKDREIPIDHAHLSRIWFAQIATNVTRVGFDSNSDARHDISELSEPPRLVVVFRGQPAVRETPAAIPKSDVIPPAAAGAPASAAARPGTAPAGRLPKLPTAAQAISSLRATPVGGERPKLRIPRVSQPPKLEEFLRGTPQEAGTRVIGFRQREPGEGVPASQETTAYLSYDDKNLYVVFVCKDEPGKVRAHMDKRKEIDSDDQVAIYLDTFSDHRRAYMFATNPLGIQKDGIFTEGQSDLDLTFDTLWYSEGRLAQEGYVVWMAIPFKSLRFSNSDLQTWGIALNRTIFRANEEDFWPYITDRIEGFTQQFAALEGLQWVSPGRNAQLIPYGLFARARALNTTDANNPLFSTDNEFRGGLDAKVVLRDALTFDLTVNPDFSQVESDQPQVTINERFEVFFPEKRPFFIENADFFQTPVDLFFSRRIADPQFGFRMTGKLSRWALGVLAIDDRGPGRNQPGGSRLDQRAGIGVIRVRRDFGDQSSIGLFVSSLDFASSSNRVFSLDTRLKLTPNWVFTGQLIGSSNRELDGRHRSGPAYLAEIGYSGRHLTYSGSYEDRSPNFDGNRLGFIERVDIQQMTHYVSYLWRPEGRRVLSFGPSLTTLVNWDRQGRVQDWVARTGFAVYLANATQLKVSRSEAFQLFKNLGFRNRSTSVVFSTVPLQWLAVSATYSGGTNVNFSPAPGLLPFLANSQNGSFEFTLRPTARFRFDQTYIYSRLGTRFAPPGAASSTSIFNNHIVRWRTSYQFTRALSLRAIVDYNSVLANPQLIAQEKTKQLTGDILLTYLLNPGTALYIGYTDRYENLALDPALPPSLRLQRVGEPTTSTGRQFFIKLSYLFRF
jgi:hypothetical protein